MKKNSILLILSILCFSHVPLCGASNIKSFKDKIKFNIVSSFVTLKLKDIRSSFGKSIKKISVKDIVFGVAICSLIAMTVKLFKQCSKMRSEIDELRTIVAGNGQLDLKNLKIDVNKLNKEVPRQCEALRLTRDRIGLLEDKHKGLEWQFHSLWKLFDQFTTRQMENAEV